MTVRSLRRRKVTPRLFIIREAKKLRRPRVIDASLFYFYLLTNGTMMMVRMTATKMVKRMIIFQ